MCLWASWVFFSFPFLQSCGSGFLCVCLCACACVCVHDVSAARWLSFFFPFIFFSQRGHWFGQALFYLSVSSVFLLLVLSYVDVLLASRADAMVVGWVKSRSHKLRKMTGIFFKFMFASNLNKITLNMLLCQIFWTIFTTCPQLDSARLLPRQDLLS